MDILDGWRAISVVLVITAHLLNFSSLKIVKVFATVTGAWGSLGVQIFFVISWFVICRGLIREYAGAGQVSLSAFYVRRFFRIAPPIVLYVAGILALKHMGVFDGVASHVSRSLIFVCNFKSIDCGGYLGGHLWSLSVEEQFYLVFPLLFWLCGRKPVVPLTVFAGVFLCLCLGLYTIKIFDVASFLADFTFIAAGVTWALNEHRVSQAVSRMPLWSFYVVAMMILLVSLYLRTRYAFGGEILLLPPLIVFILAKTLGGVPLVSPLLGYAPLSAFGRASYSMYLWQQLATYPFIGAGPGFYILTLGTCAAVTMGLYQGLERPLMTLGRSLDGKIRSGNRLAV